MARNRTEAQTAAGDLSQAMLREISLLIDSRVSDLHGRLWLAGGTGLLAVLIVLAGLGLELIVRRRSRGGAARRPGPVSRSRPTRPAPRRPRRPDAMPGRRWREPRPAGQPAARCR